MIIIISKRSKSLPTPFGSLHEDLIKLKYDLFVEDGISAGKNGNSSMDLKHTTMTYLDKAQSHLSAQMSSQVSLSFQSLTQACMYDSCMPQLKMGCYSEAAASRPGEASTSEKIGFIWKCLL